MTVSLPKTCPGSTSNAILFSRRKQPHDLMLPWRKCTARTTFSPPQMQRHRHVSCLPRGCSLATTVSLPKPVLSRSRSYPPRGCDFSNSRHTDSSLPLGCTVLHMGEGDHVIPIGPRHENTCPRVLDSKRACGALLRDMPRTIGSRSCGAPLFAPHALHIKKVCGAPSESSDFSWLHLPPLG